MGPVPEIKIDWLIVQHMQRDSDGQKLTLKELTFS